jgi:protein-S-isoprenylcysteine O-methyltransferase Ste14
MSAVPPPPPGSYATRSSANGLAVTSLVLGILGIFIQLFGILPILAIVFGVMARRRITGGSPGSSGMATAGIVLGVVGLIILIVVLIAVGANPSLFEGK